MTSVATTCILLVLCSPFAGADEQKVTIGPVTRVVELLQALSKQVEKEGKTEQGLYEDFVCWGKSIISQKIASNDDARSRVGELKTTIADLGAGRLDLTSERTDNEKEINQLMTDMESANSIRNKEHEDFLEAEDEMDAAIEALDHAIETLKEATNDHKEGVLLAVRTGLKGAAANGGMAALTQRQASLRKAVDLGERFLEKADAVFLQRVLLGQVPERAGAKKLNRKATFKMSYKARSFKILGVLEKMHGTFVDNLDDAKKNEAAALKEHEALSSTKEKQLDSTRGALGKMDGENGAKGMFLEEAHEEMADLTTQVQNDEDFIEQTRNALAEKATSWKTRSDLRAGELAAISKAIYILHNDDSRDLFKKSFSSQASFLQVQRSSHKATMNRQQKAAVALNDAALLSGDKRLLALASDLPKSVAGVDDQAKKNKNFEEFRPVVESIDTMIDLLLKEENKDLETNQMCEKDRQKSSKEAITGSRKIDEMTDIIAQRQTASENAKQKLAELQTEKTKTEDAFASALATREAEEIAWQGTHADDEEAAKTVKRARDTLAEYYVENKLSLAQKSEQPVSVAGQAPPPPPATWEGDYGGKTGESQGIVAILEMVHEDILKDMRDAEADESNSKKEFKSFKEDTETRTKILDDEILLTQKELGEALDGKATTEDLRLAEKNSVNAILKTIEGVNPNCEYYEVNYPMRRKNRQTERDGLNKAKAILMGGVFVSVDPDREMKPGDAA